MLSKLPTEKQPESIVKQISKFEKWIIITELSLLVLQNSIRNSFREIDGK